MATVYARERSAAKSWGKGKVRYSRKKTSNRVSKRSGTSAKTKMDAMVAREVQKVLNSGALNERRKVTMTLSLSETQIYINGALEMLRKIGRLVKPVMKRRGWSIGVLGEMPSDRYLLGLHTSWGLGWGGKIFLRLRDWVKESEFFPLEEIVDTMLHEYDCCRMAGAC